MAILKVARLGHPLLRQVAKPVPRDEIGSPEIQRLIDDMVETMREYDGAGLAANQVHTLRQIAVIEVLANPRYPDAPQIPLTVVINPVVTPIGEEMEDGWEGCLSVPDLRGVVPRYGSVRLECYDRDARAVSLIAKDFFARVIQHESDHLNGVVYLDRMRDLSTLAHIAEWNKHWLGPEARASHSWISPPASTTIAFSRRRRSRGCPSSASRRTRARARRSRGTRAAGASSPRRRSRRSSPRSCREGSDHDGRAVRRRARRPEPEPPEPPGAGRHAPARGGGRSECSEPPQGRAPERARGHRDRGPLARDDRRGGREARARPAGWRRGQALSDDRGAPPRARRGRAVVRPAGQGRGPALPVPRQAHVHRGARGGRPVHARGDRGRQEPPVHRVLRGGRRRGDRGVVPRRDRAGRALPPRARPHAPPAPRDDARGAGRRDAGVATHARARGGAAAHGARDGGDPSRPWLLIRWASSVTSSGGPTGRSTSAGRRWRSPASSIPTSSPNPGSPDSTTWPSAPAPERSRDDARSTGCGPSSSRRKASAATARNTTTRATPF